MDRPHGGISILFFIVFFTILNLYPNSSWAQDTLWASFENEQLWVKAKVQNNQSVTDLSARFRAPIATLANLNDADYQTIFFAGQTIKVPVGNYNLKRKPESASKPVNYKVATNQTLFIGWVTDNDAKANIPKPNVIVAPKPAFSKPENKSIVIEKTDSLKPPKNDVETLAQDKRTQYKNTLDSINFMLKATYEYQVGNVEPIIESGAATFYNHKGAKVGIYYAFHNHASRGTILKISNPASGKHIYAKVVGPIPALSDYKNCIVALSGNAATALGTSYKHTFCKIVYR